MAEGLVKFFRLKEKRFTIFRQALIKLSLKRDYSCSPKGHLSAGPFSPINVKMNVFMGNGMNNRETLAVMDQTDETSPFVIEFFMLQGVGFRCMGYRDRDGKWRSAFNHIELFGKIHVVG